MNTYLEHLIIDANELYKSYLIGSEKINVLRGINIKIRKGELVALMGPSGSGKSTLLHILGCLDYPDKGSYFFNGENVASHSDYSLSRTRACRIGFVFQSFNLIPQFDVFENVEIPFHYQPNSSPRSHLSIHEAIEKVGLKHRMHHFPAQLSGGETQRVAIARALAINPLVILADEPTGNLDSQTGKTILTLFKELNQQGVTILIVTHDQEVAKYCRRVISMVDGQITTDQSNVNN